jgi:hypothetical protein
MSPTSESVRQHTDRDLQALTTHLTLTQLCSASSASRQQHCVRHGAFTRRAFESSLEGRVGDKLDSARASHSTWACLCSAWAETKQVKR